MTKKGHSTPHRRLEAVLFADVADYTRLMGEDEVGTWRAVKNRIEIFQQLAGEYQGEVLQVRGDGLFLMFHSAVDAVSYAMEVQKRMQTLNEGLPEDRHLQFRIGINLGEILFDEGNVSGDSVNIAARIEAQARPGHVCISASVYDHVRNRLSFGYSYLGPQRLKNLREAVDVFQVHEEAAAAAMTSALRQVTPVDRASGSPTVDASVAVLPFRYQGSDPAGSWIADGLTEDLTTSLSRFHEFFVIARTSAYVLGGSTANSLDTARDLGVRYMVGGSVLMSGNRMRVTIRLVDAVSDRTIWGEQYKRQFEDIFELQEEIIQTIATATAVKIAASERERLRQVGPADLRAYGLVLQGQQHIFHYTRQENRRARLLYDEALKVDPYYARALAAKSRTLNIDWRYNWTELGEKDLDRALELALAAVELDPSDARGYGELGFAHLYLKQHDAALRAYRRGLDLNPNDADLMSDMADALGHAGQAEQGIALVQKAMRLNPFYPDQYLWHLGGLYFKLRQYEEAIQTVQGMQNQTEGRRILAASYAHLGRLPEARFQAAKILDAHPEFRIDHWAAIQPDKLEAETADFVEGLRKAGL